MQAQATKKQHAANPPMDTAESKAARSGALPWPQAQAPRRRDPHCAMAHLDHRRNRVPCSGSAHARHRSNTRWRLAVAIHIASLGAHPVRQHCDVPLKSHCGAPHVHIWRSSAGARADSKSSEPAHHVYTPLNTSRRIFSPCDAHLRESPPLPRRPSYGDWAAPAAAESESVFLNAELISPRRGCDQPQRTDPAQSRGRLTQKHKERPVGLRLAQLVLALGGALKSGERMFRDQSKCRNGAVAVTSAPRRHESNHLCSNPCLGRDLSVGITQHARTDARTLARARTRACTHARAGGQARSRHRRAQRRTLSSSSGTDDIAVGAATDCLRVLCLNAASCALSAAEPRATQYRIFQQCTVAASCTAKSAAGWKVSVLLRVL